MTGNAIGNPHTHARGQFNTGSILYKYGFDGSLKTDTGENKAKRTLYIYI